MEQIFLIYFQKQLKSLLKKYSSLNSDLAELRVSLNINPQTGTPLGGDCYKIRIAIKSKGRGKSGGGRVITCVKILSGRIYFLSIYDKSEQEDIPDVALAVLIEMVDEIEKGNAPNITDAGA